MDAAPAMSDRDLRATLDAIGDTAAVAAELVAPLDERALRAAAAGTTSCAAILQQLVEAGVELGRVAHDVLGHPPGAADSYARPADQPTGAQLLQRLGFLREHIVSTVEQQGAAVWSTPTVTGRPLFAYAQDLQRRDDALLAALRDATARARQG